MAKRDYYEVLGIPRNADDAQIKKAYRKLAIKLHPDRNPDDASAEDKFKEASEAFAVLSDTEKRRRYDRMGHAAFESTGPGGFDPTDFGAVGDFLEGIFGEIFGRRARRTGRDLAVDLSVDFVEAALGADKTLVVSRAVICDRCGGEGGEPGTPVNQCGSCSGRGEVRYQRGFFMTSRPCPSCSGTGKQIAQPCAKCNARSYVQAEEEMSVRIPAGVANGAVRTVRGAGEVGPGGPGDLHVTVRVTEHPLFDRDGADVLCTVPVSFPQAVLGATIDVPTLEGKVQMKVPPGTQSGKIFRLRGKGIPVYGGAGKGDQLVTIAVEVPGKITRKQRRLIEELAAELGVDTHPQQASFLDKLKALFE